MSSFVKQLFPFASEVKFTPASQEINWTRIETLVHGPGAGEDKRSVNSAVFACLMAIATSYPEPPLAVMQEDAEGNQEHLLDHPLQEILDFPTPAGELSMDEMLFWTAWAKHIDGNAYWLKIRSGNADTGNVIQLWPVSPTMIEPVTEKDDQGRAMDWISYYKYRIAPNKTVSVPVQNVVHFRLGIDDQDMRKGKAPLKALIRQIATDDEADKFVETLLRNYAVPGLVVHPAGGSTIGPQDAETMTHKLQAKFGNDNRGNIAVLSRESKIEQFGFSPEQLNLSILHRIPEERISAVMGVPAIVAGLGAGLDRATYANFKEAREMFTEQKLVPQWRADAKKIDVSLKPDFTAEKNISVMFDLTNVRSLQEDTNEIYSRLSTATGQKAFMTRNEARSEVGLDPVEEWDEADLNPPQPPPGGLFGQNGNQNGNDPDDDEGESTNGRQPAGAAARYIDLEKWHRKALKALKKGTSAAVNFESDHIPLALAGAIAGALEYAKTAEDIEAVFSDVWLGYP